MKLMKTEDAVGQVLCHDITQIIKGVTKDAVFRKGHIITEEDIPVLLSVGKDNIYIWEKDDTMLHENEAAQILYDMCKNDHMHPSDVKEGKIELIADCDGLLKVDREKLKKVNSLGEMMIATYVGFSAISFMCMMWLLLPYKHPTMVWGFSASGLRTVISLEGYYDKALANILTIDLNSIGINLVIPTGTLLFFVLMAVLMWAFLHTKTGTAMTAVGSNPAFARAAGINVDKMRLISVIMSTWLGAVGILVYEQGFGFIQLYNGPFWMAMPAVAAILIGGASVNKASIGNVIIGTILYQGVVTMTPTVMSAAFQMDMSEVIRIVVSNGMILYALTRKTERGR